LIKTILSHGIIHVSHVAGLLSLSDDVTEAIDVQVAKNKGDLEQEIVIFSQLYLINVQQLRGLGHLAVRLDMTDICSICQEECESILSKRCKRWEHPFHIVVFHGRI
jgi:hypothetical protein